MADELAQVIEVEFQALKIVVIGTVETAKFILKALRALTDRQEKFKEKWENFNQQREERIEINMLEAPGEKSLINLMKLSETQGGMVQVIKVPEKHIEAFLETCKKNGLRYSNGVDFLASDGMMPFFFAPKDYIIAAEILEQFIKKDLNEDREEVKNYAQRIKEAKAERESVPPEEKEKYDVLIENLEQAKQEREKTINESEQKLENGMGESFQEYLAEAKGTEFEKDPDKAVSEYDRGVVIDKAFSCEECLQPIRDKDSVPMSGMYFYLPEIGCVINRKFHMDENNLVYSSYTLKTDKGEIYEFSDKNITKKEWNENKEYLSALLDKAGIIPSNIPCRVFLTEEQLDNYITNHNKTETKAEKNVKERKRDSRIFLVQMSKKHMSILMNRRKRKGICENR